MSQATTIGIVGMKSPIGRRIAAVAAGIALLLAIAAAASALYMSYVPADLDVSTTRATENGHYVVSYEPARDPIPVGELHAWTVRVVTPDGEPVDDATITVDGDMPQHGHGLPTRPRMTQSLGGGAYLVEGMKFQMGGWWYVDFAVSAGGRTDHVRFDFLLP